VKKFIFFIFYLSSFTEALVDFLWVKFLKWET
jgi:hypothetical protein